jgi:hypothetical protein
MAFIEPTEGEAQSAADIAAARQAFLSEPPEIISSDPEPVVDEAAQAAADEAAAIEELSQAPAAPEGEQSPPPAPAPTGTPDPYSQFGGEEAVRTAYQVQQAMRTEQGVRALVANGLAALGYEPDAIKQALDGQAAPTPAAPVDPFAGLDDDDVVDVKTVRQLVEQLAAQQKPAEPTVDPRIEQVQQQLLAQQQQQVRGWTDTALIEVLGAPPEDEAERKVFATQVDQTVARAGAYYNPQLANDPAHIRSCIQQAHADLEAEADARLKAYIASKKRTRDSQPVNVGGGAGSEGPLPEPKNMGEAREQARKSGFFS